MKLVPVTKLDCKNTATLSKFVNDVMSTNCDVVALFPIYDQLAVIRKLDSQRRSIKLTFSLTIIFYLTKTECKTKKVVAST